MSIMNLVSVKMTSYWTLFIIIIIILLFVMDEHNPVAVPAEAVGECGGPAGVSFSVEGWAVSSRAEGPEGRGRTWQVQADVPERVDGRRHTAGRRGGQRRSEREGREEVSVWVYARGSGVCVRSQCQNWTSTSSIWHQYSLFDSVCVVCSRDVKD